MPLNVLTPETAQTPRRPRQRPPFSPLRGENHHTHAASQQHFDRFIPRRSVGADALGVSTFEIEKALTEGASAEQEPEMNASPAKEEYKKRLATNLFRGEPANNRVLSFSARRDEGGVGGVGGTINGGGCGIGVGGCGLAGAGGGGGCVGVGGGMGGLGGLGGGGGASSSSAAAVCAAVDASGDSLRLLYSLNRHALPRASWSGRVIPQSPERILDAPELMDDYYLNLLDWNADNILGVALGESVYLWNAANGAITPLMQTSGDGCHVTSIAWAPAGAQMMAIGTSDHRVQLWDTEKCQLVRTMEGHAGRVGVLSWNRNQITSGARDATILHRDARAPGRPLAALRAHTQEVCGLKWSLNGAQLASGGNDNLLHVWDERRLASPPLHAFTQHKAAVKALAWCPWQKHVLASGGGTADRTIRFWNVQTGQLINAVDTHSQVCALQWSQHDKELVSSHGYSHNQLILWKYPSMVKLAELTGHTSRVLHMAQSPDGTTVVSAAADETLRFWKILGADADSRRGGGGESVLDLGSSKRTRALPLSSALSGATPSAWTVR